MSSPVPQQPPQSPTDRGGAPTGGAAQPGAGAAQPGAGAAQPAVSELAERQLVDGVYVIATLQRLVARTGQPYLALQVRDRTGSITARLFQGADAALAGIQRGDAVRVRGRVERFRDELQLELQSIVRAEGVDPASLLPTAYRDLDELDGFLDHLATEVSDPGYAALLAAVLGDGDLRAQIRRAPCSRAGHHAYLGGLLEHTVAVAQLAWELCALHPRLDSDLLITAALLHDVGKTREFTYTGAIELSPEGRLLGHIELGLQLLTERRPRTLGDERWLALAHCVLTHHGADATPTRSFQSSEAIALHRLNAVDAQVKYAFEHGL